MAKQKTKEKDNRKIIKVGDEPPAFEVGLPYAYIEMEINDLITSDTLDDLLEGGRGPKYNLRYNTDRERKAASTLRKLYNNLREIYQNVTDGRIVKAIVYEVEYIGPLQHMFVREDGKEVKYVTRLEAEVTNGIMQEMHSMVVRSIGWQDTSLRLGINLYRIKRLWTRYQAAIEYSDGLASKNFEVLHLQRHEYVLRRIMRLAEKDDDIRSWKAVLEALAPMQPYVEKYTQSSALVESKREQVLDRMRLLFQNQRERWIEEGKLLEKRKDAIEVIPQENKNE